MKFGVKADNAEFFEYYKKPVRKLVIATDHLRKMVDADIDQREGYAKEIGKLERLADEDRRNTIKRIMSSFVTPFDGGDLYELAIGIERCINAIDAIAESIVIMKIDYFHKKVIKQVKILQRCAELTKDVIDKIAKNEMNQLGYYCDEVSYLEHEADRARRSQLAKLFEDVKLADAKQFLKEKELLEVLEWAVNSYKEMSAVVEVIMLKEA